jgi:hypothetical protein
LAEPVGVVHNGRKKINGLDQRQIIGNPIDSGIIRPLQPDDDIGIGWDEKSAQRFVQVPWRQFGRSAGPFDGAAQTNLLHAGHMSISLPGHIFGIHHDPQLSLVFIKNFKNISMYCLPPYVKLKFSISI